MLIFLVWNYRMLVRKKDFGNYFVLIFYIVVENIKIKWDNYWLFLIF